MWIPPTRTSGRTPGSERAQRSLNRGRRLFCSLRQGGREGASLIFFLSLSLSIVSRFPRIAASTARYTGARRARRLPPTPPPLVVPPQWCIVLFSDLELVSFKIQLFHMNDDSWLFSGPGDFFPSATGGGQRRSLGGLEAGRWGEPWPCRARSEEADRGHRDVGEDGGRFEDPTVR